MSLLLAVTVYQLILTDELPSSSEALPLIGTLMLCYDLILVTCSHRYSFVWCSFINKVDVCN